MWIGLSDNNFDDNNVDDAHPARANLRPPPAIRYSSITSSRCLGAIILVSLSVFSYWGILEDHANVNMPKGTKKGGNSSSDALAGGALLDLLGLVVVIQYYEHHFESIRFDLPSERCSG